MKRSRRLLLVAASLFILLLASSCSPEEADAFKAVNTLRESNHVAALEWNEGAYEKAVAWSNHMADEGQLSHSNLADGVPAGWHVLGENVAYAGSVAAAMQALEHSPPHLANILNARFTSVSIGIVERDNRYWVTEVFVG